MPKFSISTDVDVDVDVDEFLGSCSPFEIRELVKDLISRGYIIKERDASLINTQLIDEYWVEGCEKLSESKFKLTVEEEETIKKIMNRL